MIEICVGLVAGCIIGFMCQKLMGKALSEIAIIKVRLIAIEDKIKSTYK
jgi:uncharacterized membrane-anchored protein YhcB (DUF1043 family)